MTSSTLLADPPSNETIDVFYIKIIMTPTITEMVTEQGKTRAYLHRFKLLEDATCVCMHGDQITDHLLNHCTLVQTKREILKQTILKTGNWPGSKQELITKYRDSFITFTVHAGTNLCFSIMYLAKGGLPRHCWRQGDARSSDVALRDHVLEHSTRCIR